MLFTPFSLLHLLLSSVKNELRKTGVAVEAVQGLPQRDMTAEESSDDSAPRTATHREASSRKL